MMKEKIVTVLKYVSRAVSGVCFGRVIGDIAKGNNSSASLFFAVAMGFGVFCLIGWTELLTRQKDKLTTRLIFTRLFQTLLFSVGAYVFFYKNFISPATFLGNGLVFIPVALVLFFIPLAMLYTELAYWWENARKLLFFNRVVDVKNYEFLLTFDRKNELLKFVGTIREMKDAKWRAFLLSLPFVAACRITSFAMGTMCALFSAELCYGIYRFGMSCTLIAYYIIWVTDIKSAQKFFKKKK